MATNFLLVLLLGLFIGSFINAMVWRLKNKKNWISGRSCCEHCAHRLSVVDLIPVISWLALRGRCRYCGHKIGLEPLYTEIVTGVLFAGSYWLWPYPLDGINVILFGIWLITLTGLIALALYDFKYMLLPNGLVIFVTVVSTFFVLFGGYSGILRISSSLYGGLALGGFFVLLWWVSKGKWIGGGDVKLSFALGLLSGSILGAMFVLLLSSFLGTLYGLPQLLSKGKRSKKHVIPYGPFLIISTYIIVLLGNQILRKVFYIN